MSTNIEVSTAKSDDTLLHADPRWISRSVGVSLSVVLDTILAVEQRSLTEAFDVAPAYKTSLNVHWCSDAAKSLLEKWDL